MAGSEADAGADAVALAIRDLTEEIRKLKRAVCVCGLNFLEVHAGSMTENAKAYYWAEYDRLAKGP